MITIEVRVFAHTLCHLEHDIHIGWHVLKELKAARIPVEGTLIFRGVSDGELTVYTDIDGDLVFQWRGENPLPEKVALPVADIDDIS